MQINELFATTQVWVILKFMIEPLKHMNHHISCENARWSRGPNSLIAGQSGGTYPERWTNLNMRLLERCWKFLFFVLFCFSFKWNRKRTSNHSSFNSPASSPTYLAPAPLNAIQVHQLWTPPGQKINNREEWQEKKPLSTSPGLLSIHSSPTPWVSNLLACLGCTDWRGTALGWSKSNAPQLFPRKLQPIQRAQ